MNPVLAILAILTLAGLLLLNRREIGIPWAACGLAGIALLWPALQLPGGVPSPAATLAMQTPWQGMADPAAGTYQVSSSCATRALPLHFLSSPAAATAWLGLLPWLRAVIGGCGAWSLAREVGASHRGPSPFWRYSPPSVAAHLPLRSFLELAHWSMFRLFCFLAASRIE